MMLKQAITFTFTTVALGTAIQTQLKDTTQDINNHSITLVQTTNEEPKSTITFEILDASNPVKTKTNLRMKTSGDLNKSAVTSLVGMFVLDPSANKTIGQRQYNLAA